MGQVFAGRAPQALVEKLKMSDFWTEAPIEWVVLAWAPFSGRMTSNVVDHRFRTEVGSITPEERACMLGYRLACSHGHGDASLVPGPWSAVWAMRHGFPQEWDDGSLPGIPIRSIQQHITGTGRLRWTALGDGSLLIEVWRGPSGDAEPHIVLSAIVRTETPSYASAPEWNDGIDPSRISVRAHAAYGRRHLDTMVSAIRMACGRPAEDEVADLKIEGLPSEGFALARIADANPEPDPWDPANAPAVPPVGTRVRVVPESYNNPYLARVTGATAEWDWYQRGWTLLVEAEEGGWGRYALVREIRPEPEAEAPEA